MRHRSMRVRWSGLVTEAVAVGVAAAGWWVYSLRAVQSPGEPHPPKTMTEPVTDNYHGVQVVDPYRGWRTNTAPPRAPGSIRRIATRGRSWMRGRSGRN